MFTGHGEYGLWGEDYQGAAKAGTRVLIWLVLIGSVMIVGLHYFLGWSLEAAAISWLCVNFLSEKDSRFMESLGLWKRIEKLEKEIQQLREIRTDRQAED